MHPRLWTIVKDLNTGMSSKVKWMGKIGQKFPIHQRARQCGVLSTHLYKVYINSFLHEFNRSRIDMKIGNIYVGSPTCADDMALLTDNHEDMQIMLNTSLRNSKQDRVTIHPTKTNDVVLSKGKTVEKNLKWELENNIVTPTEQTKHLGIIRSEIKENEINIEDRLTLARRTVYSLINTGVHGSNGINPIVSCTIFIKATSFLDFYLDFS